CVFRFVQPTARQEIQNHRKEWAKESHSVFKGGHSPEQEGAEESGGGARVVQGALGLFKLGSERFDQCWQIIAPGLEQGLEIVSQTVLVSVNRAKKRQQVVPGARFTTRAKLDEDLSAISEESYSQPI